MARSVKNRKKYEALKDKGMSKKRAAKIANSGKAGSPQRWKAQQQEKVEETEIR